MRRRFTALLAVAVMPSIVATVPAMAAHDFEDVPDTNIFHADISWLAEEGITRGCNPPDNTLFCPSDNVTRGQMAAFFVRGLGLTSTDGGTDFTDTEFAGRAVRTGQTGKRRWKNAPQCGRIVS